ncbi:cysteine-rich receptor-like protein kinase, partial [Trifolium pratense]
MNIMSLNLRGWGDAAKRRRLSSLLHSDVVRVAKDSIGLSSDGLLYIVNIYSPCSLDGKGKLWKDLLEFKSNNAIGDWVLGVDFNAISKNGERRGCSGSGSLSERSEFSLFMEAMEVIDIPVLGKKFTWFNSDGSTMSRFDRFLLSEGFIHKE